MANHRVLWGRITHIVTLGAYGCETAPPETDEGHLSG
jgi:hypothetical protein